MNKIRQILLVTDAFDLLAGGLIGPIYAIYVQKIGGDILEAGTTFAIFTLTAGFVTYLLALWEDKTAQQKWFVVAGYGFGVLGYFSYLFVTSAMGLFLVQVILGFSYAIKSPAYDALFSESKKHLTLAWGQWETISHVALGIGAISGGFIAQRYGFYTLLLCMFGLSLLSFVISMLLLHKKLYARAI